jgi:hypothetical protein
MSAASKACQQLVKHVGGSTSLESPSYQAPAAEALHILVPATLLDIIKRLKALDRVCKRMSAASKASQQLVKHVGGSTSLETPCYGARAAK